ncbi:MAG: heme ABC exporter ATP-binding protein CcmA [Pseudomonadota bacterium]
MLLQCDNLALARGGLPVLRGLSFSLHRGGALTLRGPNGVGKTTVLRTVAGLVAPLEGEITRPKDGLAYAGHADGIKVMLSVRENLRFWADIFGAQGVEDAMAAFVLTPLADRLAGSLSAGQKRRLGLARLLVTGAPLWVLDEPTVSLDSASVELFAAAVEAHLARGGAALMATHIDIGLPAEALDLTPYRCVAVDNWGTSDEAFL